MFVPAVNRTLMVAVAGLVIGFGSSAALAAAYGIAVTGTLAIDTILFFVVVRTLWGRPLWLAIAGAAAFLVVDLSFLAANLSKIFHGGWFPLLVALVIFTILITWSTVGRSSPATAARTRGRCGPSSTRSTRWIHRSPASPGPRSS